MVSLDIVGKRWIEKLQDEDYAWAFSPQLVVIEYFYRYRLLPSLKNLRERATFSFKIRQILFCCTHLLNPAVFYSQVS